MQNTNTNNNEAELAASLAPVEPVALRQAMGSFLTGVTVVTARNEQGLPYGLTVNSFNSVSLDPPLVLWSLDKRNDKLDLFRNAGGFTVNIMRADQEDLIWLFARAESERFADTKWSWGVSNQPVLSNTLVSLECRAWAEYPGGDHVIFVGEVVNIVSSEGSPAAFFEGQLGAYQP
jgi:3-hydroxy-9,10-secoandrosta-1,3,5(10)-triene-9,17-dione monooxygenase reductase component